MDIEKLDKELISIYSKYCANPESEELRLKAMNIYQEYSGAATFLKKEIALAVNRLIDIAADTGVNPPSKKEAGDILTALERLQR